MQSEHLELMGFHFHVGSQLQNNEDHLMAVEILLDLVREVRRDLGMEVKELNLGGITKKDGSTQYGEVVYLTKEEEEDLRKVQQTGCRLFIQQLPTTKKEELNLLK